MRELGRKSIHLLFGSLFILSAVFLGGYNTLLITVGAFVGGITVSYLIKQGLDFPVFSLAVELFERREEKETPGKGAILFFLGTIILIWLALFVFHREKIIAPALVPLVFGDGIATITGTHWGKHRIIKGKSLEGTLSGFIASVLVLSIFLWPSWIKILSVAAAAMLVELLPLNDNLTIPIISGIMLYLLL